MIVGAHELASKLQIVVLADCTVLAEFLASWTALIHNSNNLHFLVCIVLVAAPLLPVDTFLQIVGLFFDPLLPLSL